MILNGNLKFLSQKCFEMRYLNRGISVRTTCLWAGCMLNGRYSVRNILRNSIHFIEAQVYVSGKESYEM